MPKSSKVNSLFSWMNDLIVLEPVKPREVIEVIVVARILGHDFVESLG